MNSELILAGDVGGTNTRLAIFDEDLETVGQIYKFPTGDGSKLEAHLREVIRACDRPIDRICLAAAGPVIDGVCVSTNIGRTFVAKDIGRTLGVGHFTLINDLVANAAGIERLGENEIATLRAGEDRPGTRAIVSPGTGLGEGILVWDGRHHRPLPSEGGHSLFAPSSTIERDLLRHVRPDGGRVTCEDLISGKGIEPIYDLIREQSDDATDAARPPVRSLPAGERAKHISQSAVEGTDTAAVKAMQLFVRLLAIEAASMALKTFAIGGVYLGGGIPPKILPLLKTPAVADAFIEHPAMSDFLKKIPLRVILNDDTALEGAALYGQRFGD